MPELPEVESLRRTLEPAIIGRTITAAHIGERRLRRKVESALESGVAGRRIERLSRRAKYLIIELDGGCALLVHLGMSGSLTHRHPSFSHEQLDPRHDHARFVLDDDTQLVYNDPRRFGMLKLVSLKDLDSSPELKGLGPEPMGEEFNLGYLVEKARGRKVAIKNLLMDQRIVAGVGNIYASELLFRAGVRPARRAGRVGRAELERIVVATREVIREAIGARGTTFRSYLDSRGEPGSFGTRLRVYGREGEACYICSTPIRNVTLGQRASFYCPQCQR